MTVTYPLSITTQSQLYNNVHYVTYIQSNVPEKGSLDYALLRNNVNISCYIKVQNSLISEYEYAIITLAYKQVKSKSKRYKTILKMPQKSNVLYRNNLEPLLSAYKLCVSTENYSEVKLLLLNDLTDANDSKVGDTGIECMFRFKKFDGSSEYMLYPGAASGELFTVVGLSVFNTDSVDEIFVSIINDMSDLLQTHVLLNSYITVTPQLISDIKRYIYFCIYGN